MAQIPLFAELPKGQLQGLVRTLNRRTYERGQIILHQGDEGDSLYVVHRGRVRIYTLSPEGQELSVWICDAGEFFGEMALLSDQPRSACAEAMEPTEVLVLHRQAFRDFLLSNPAAALRVLESLSQRLRRTTESAEGLVSLNVTQRIARKLLHLAGEYGVGDEEGVTIDLDLSQEAIATLVGTTRESANRALSALRDQGLIRVQRAHIRLLDPDRLAALLS